MSGRSPFQDTIPKTGRDWVQTRNVPELQGTYLPNVSQDKNRVKTCYRWANQLGIFLPRRTLGSISTEHEKPCYVSFEHTNTVRHRVVPSVLQFMNCADATFVNNASRLCSANLHSGNTKYLRRGRILSLEFRQKELRMKCYKCNIYTRLFLCEILPSCFLLCFGTVLKNSLKNIQSTKNEIDIQGRNEIGCLVWWLLNMR